MNLSELNREIAAAATELGLLPIEAATIDPAIPRRMSNIKEACVLIKGENLQVLSSLVDAGTTCIDFCYIDPPYNTGQDFVYADSRMKPSKTVWGRHRDWLAFMLPRLMASRSLLKPKGVMAISIDDYEYAHLKILMDHVFSARNHMATLVVCRSKNGKGSKQHVAANHEYVLLYGKSQEASVAGLPEGSSKTYEKQDEHGEYTIDGLFRKKGDASRREDRPNMYYPLFCSPDGRVSTERHDAEMIETWPHDSKGIARRWLWGIEKTRAESWRLFASRNGVVYVKNYKAPDKRAKLRSILDHPDYLTDKATREIKEVYGEKVFETPKPLALIRDLIDCCAPEDGLVLDFFAGTGTTAIAAWELNRRARSKRQVVLVEQVQPIRKGHIARQRGFSVTSDLTEYRLRHLQSSDALFSYAIVPGPGNDGRPSPVARMEQPGFGASGVGAPASQVKMGCTDSRSGCIDKTCSDSHAESAQGVLWE